MLSIPEEQNVDMEMCCEGVAGQCQRNPEVGSFEYGVRGG